MVGSCLIFPKASRSSPSPISTKSIIINNEMAMAWQCQNFDLNIGKAFLYVGSANFTNKKHWKIVTDCQDDYLRNYLLVGCCIMILYLKGRTTGAASNEAASSCNASKLQLLLVMYTYCLALIGFVFCRRPIWQQTIVMFACIKMYHWWILRLQANDINPKFVGTGYFQLWVI